MPRVYMEGGETARGVWMTHGFEDPPARWEPTPEPSDPPPHHLHFVILLATVEAYVNIWVPEAVADLKRIAP
ncbi:hypothetical protein Y032_0025g1199 [Ancylostoma ceylanicum]|uniref:Uncharacterized protein n=1 Tax=Ancylostoma ceylanicum TaxID=53326 RepID=A0A016UWL7_9BILA|nr:hypothetical protein Y032_0025g1199 [Ancylostoma ceylanicum]